MCVAAYLGPVRKQHGWYWSLVPRLPALGFGLYLDVVIEKNRRHNIGYVVNFTIEQHSKMTRRQDARLAMLFFYRILAVAVDGNCEIAELPGLKPEKIEGF